MWFLLKLLLLVLHQKITNHSHWGAVCINFNMDLKLAENTTIQDGSPTMPIVQVKAR